MTNVTVVFNEGVAELYVNGVLEANNSQFSTQNTKTIPEHLDDAGLGGVSGTTIWGSSIPNFSGIVDTFTYWNDALKPAIIAILATRVTASNNNARVANNEKIKEPDFSIFPNPATDELNILVEVQTSGSINIELFDLAGRKVYEMNKPNVSKGHQLITLKNLKIAAGEYIVNFRAGNLRRTEKVIFK
jgi:hypothetical protein